MKHGQRPGAQHWPSGYQHGQGIPAEPRRHARGKSWPARHKALTAILGCVALLSAIVAVSSRGFSAPPPIRGATVALTASASPSGGKTPARTAGKATEKKTPKKHEPKKKHHPKKKHQKAKAAPAKHTHAPATKAPATQAPATPAPATQAPATQAAAPPAPSSAAPAGCYPLTDGGNCYKPGEYCRDSDHGDSGVAGDGEAITCADNDGWRWEPV